MERYKVLAVLFGTFCMFAVNVGIIHSQEKPAAGTVQVHMVITDQAVRDDSEVPILRAENVKVKQGKDFLKVAQLIPARGDNDALQLFILIDDTCDPSIGSNLNDIRDFINAQPASALIGVAYMSNATVQIAQNFTADHALAAKALRLPRGTVSSMDSPYLSLSSLVKGWPQQNVRREVLMISDGIDRLRGERSQDSQMSSRNMNGIRTRSSQITTLPSMSPNVDSASADSQRYGVIVHSIYATGIGRLGRNWWEAEIGQSGVAKIADETGGEYFALGTQNAVSFKPYLDRLQRIFANQYYLVFQAIPRKKAGLQRVNMSTETANADIAAADSVWVRVSGAPAANKE
jgi:hypothetical protein